MKHDNHQSKRASALTPTMAGCLLVFMFLLNAGCSDDAPRTNQRRSGDRSLLPTPADPKPKTKPDAVAQLTDWLKAPADSRGTIDDQAFGDQPLTRPQVMRVRDLLWNDYVQRIRATRADEMKQLVLRHGDKAMPLWYAVYGDKPSAGRSLFISMHGGGGAPKQVNDSQWENQKRLYKPAEGVYVAPRAPTDTWNLWHQGHIDPLFDRLITNLVVLEGVNPDRVYLMGYSAGGDGVYQLAPRMADRWAAASMMAGHPNESLPQGLRNTPFTIHIGENDAGYNRNKVAVQWGEKLAALQKDDPAGYVHEVSIHKGLGHWMQRRDAVALEWMAKHTRNPTPKRVIWRQDDVTHDRFYWLALPEGSAKKGTEIVATVEGQRVTLESNDVKRVIVRLSDALVDLDKPVTIAMGDKILFEGKVERTAATIAKTLEERGDSRLMFDAEVEVMLP